ncbi:MAG: hypothetical protein VYA30_13525 [Myxococcota bacterium]|nr:hypothetical protein [Myxococcota bacterium]
MKQFFYLAGMLATLSAPIALSASPLDIFEFEARGSAMGGAMTAGSNDYTAVFYNPGALTQAKTLTTGFGLLSSFPQASLSLNKTAQDDASRPLEPGQRHGISMGLSTPLGGGIGNRFALGIGIYAPFAHSLRGEILAPQAPQFYRYQNRPDRFVGLSALAFKVTNWLSIGIGVSLLADLVGRVRLDLRVSERRVVSQSARVDFPLKLTPTAGIVLTPFAAFKLGLSWRKDTMLNFKIPSALAVDDAIELEFVVGGVVLYSPETYALGMSYAFSHWDAVVSVDALWTRWSKAPDPSLRINVNAAGPLLDALGVEDRLDIQGRPPIDLAFRDVVQFKVGLEQPVFEQLTLRTGYHYRPAPAPLPSGPYNYLDPSSHRASLGMGVQLSKADNPSSRTVSLDLAYAATVIPQVKIAQRAGPLDPVGDFVAKAVIHSVNISLLHKF